MSFSISSVKLTSTDVTASLSCSILVAPIMFEVTKGLVVTNWFANCDGSILYFLAILR